jgi:ribonucleoside-diphosphate reductase alpha chain
MTGRERLPHRRPSLTFDVEAQGLKFTATISRGADGTVQEIFLRNHKSGSDAGINAQDSAVVCSIALQYGVPLDVIRRALMRDARGVASSPLGVTLDTLAGEAKP